MRIRISYFQLFMALFVLVIGAASLIGHIYSDELHEYFRDRTPHDLIVASGFDVQAQSSQDFIFTDPQIVRLIDREINSRSIKKMRSSKVVQLREKQQELISVSRIIADTSRSMQGKLRQDELAEVIDWYQSPLGKKVVLSENRATTLENYPPQQKNATRKIKDQAGDQRIQLINRLVLILKSLTDQSLPIFPHRAAINLAVAQSHKYGDIKTIGFVGNGLSFAREGDQDNLYHQFKTMLLFTYKDLSDDELSGYCDFLNSPLGSKSYVVMSRAFQTALLDAISDYNTLIKTETKFHASLKPENPVRNIFVQVDEVGKFTFPSATSSVENIGHSEQSFSASVSAPVISEQSSRLDAALNQGFGLKYRVLGELGNARVPVTINLRHPPLQNPATGSVSTENSWRRIPRLGETSIASWKFEHPWQLVPGEWVMKIMYQGETLVEQKFAIRVQGQGAIASRKVVNSDGHEDKERIYQLNGFKRRNNKMSLVTGGQHLLFVGGKELAIWDVNARKLDTQKYKIGSGRYPYSSYIAGPQGRSFLAILASRQLSLVHFNKERTQYFLDESSAGYMSIGMAYSSSGTKVVSLHDDTVEPKGSTIYDPTVSWNLREKNLPDRKPITKIWDSSNGENLARLVDFSMPVIDPLERYIAGISNGNKIAFHDLSTGKKIFQTERLSSPADINGAPAKIVLLKPSPTGDYLLACNQDKTIVLIDFVGRKVLKEITLDTYISMGFAKDKINFDPTGDFFFVDGRFIRVWSTKTGRLLCDVKSPNGSALDLNDLIVNIKHNLIIASLRHNLLVFDLNNGLLKESYSNEYGRIGMDPSHQKLIAERGNVLKIFDLTGEAKTEDFGLKGRLHKMYDPSEPNSYGRAVILTRGTDMSLQLWDPFTGEPIDNPSLSFNSWPCQIQNGVWITGDSEDYYRVMDKKTGQRYGIKIEYDEDDDAGRQ